MKKRHKKVFKMKNRHIHMEKNKKMEILEKEIADLEKGVKSEKQPDRQFKLCNELGKKKKELLGLK